MVECHPSKVDVAGSNPVSRSILNTQKSQFLFGFNNKDQHLLKYSFEKMFMVVLKNVPGKILSFLGTL